jgi:tetratricopeptide (TPR) repeat protein
MTHAPARRRDRRLPTLLFMVAAVAALGYGFSLLPGRGVQVAQAGSAPDLSTLPASSADARRQMTEAARIELSADAQDPDAPRARKVLAQADEQLRQRKFNEAIATLHQERELMQKYAESYLLLGRALEGRKEYAAARDFYMAAIDRNPLLSEAYWGFATTSEELSDLESALGGMRSYLHTEPDRDPNRLKIAQARSAIWEWESKLGRGPWGPTKGIPPGFTAAELKRDGKGVGVKMPVPGSEGPDGRMQYEIKSADKIQIFKR